MKRIIISLIVAVLAIAAGAQDLSFLKGQSVILYEFDWSRLRINNLDLENWLAYRQAEQPQYDAEREYETELKPSAMKLIDEANAVLVKQQMMLLAKGNAQYTVRIIPISFSKNGNNTISFEFVDNSTGEVVSSMLLSGSGGIFGTMGNLWGDGMKRTGKKLGKEIKKQTK